MIELAEVHARWQLTPRPACPSGPRRRRRGRGRVVANTKSASLIKSRKAVRQIGRVSTRCVSRAALVSRGDRSFGDAHDRPARRRVPRRVLVPRRRRRDGVQNVRREPSIRARSSHPRARPTHLTLVRLTSPPRPRVHSRRPAGTFAWTSSIPCRSWLAAPSSPPGAVSSRGRSRRTSRRLCRPSQRASRFRRLRRGTRPRRHRRYPPRHPALLRRRVRRRRHRRALRRRHRQARRRGGDGRPAIRTSALCSSSRRFTTRLASASRPSSSRLSRCLQDVRPAPGDEAEAAQDLLAAVAETSTKEWLLGRAPPPRAAPPRTARRSRKSPRTAPWTRS